MNIKVLTTATLLGVFLAGSNAQAWSNVFHGYNKHHSHNVKRYKVKTIVNHVYVKPNKYHSHPANSFTNDTYHSHANGKNHHVHNYGKGGHKHGAYHYSVCPYAH